MQDAIATALRAEPFPGQAREQRRHRDDRLRGPGAADRRRQAQRWPAISWLAAQRNSSGGFGSTQDTVVALQAMTTAASDARADIDATVFLRSATGARMSQINRRERRHPADLRGAGRW